MIMASARLGGTVTAREHAERGGEVRRRVPTAGSSRTGLLGLAAVIVLAACAVAAPTPGPSSAPGGSAPDQPAASTPSPSTGPASGEWELLPEIAAFTGAQVADVERGAAGLIALGTAVAVGGAVAEGRPAVWSSADGRTWTEPVELPLPTPAPAVVGADAVTRFGEGFVAVGEAVTEAGIVGLAWTSVDGRSWTVDRIAAGACPADVASRGSLIVAVGTIGPCHSGGAGQPGTWTSADGRTWRAGTLTGDDGRFGAFAVVAATADLFVAAGSVGSTAAACDTGCAARPEHRLDGAPWISADGRTWRRVADPAPFELSGVRTVVAGRTGLVAAGSPWYTPTGPDSTVLWRSADGRAWTVAEPAPPFADRLGISLTATDAGIALLTLDSTTAGAPARAWTSADGIVWRQLPTLPLPPGGQVARIVGFGGGLAVIGQRDVAAPGATCPGSKDDVLAGRCRTIVGVWLRGSPA